MSAMSFLTPGCTFGLNPRARRLAASGDRVVASSVEHNATARPLARLAAAGVEVSVVQARLRRSHRSGRRRRRRARAADARGGVPARIERDRRHPAGRGPGRHSARAWAVLIVDGAQGVGHLPVDLTALVLTRTRVRATKDSWVPRASRSLPGSRLRARGARTRRERRQLRR